MESQEGFLEEVAGSCRGASMESSVFWVLQGEGQCPDVRGWGSWLRRGTVGDSPWEMALS